MTAPILWASVQQSTARRTERSAKPVVFPITVLACKLQLDRISIDQNRKSRINDRITADHSSNVSKVRIVSLGGLIGLVQVGVGSGRIGTSWVRLRTNSDIDAHRSVTFVEPWRTRNDVEKRFEGPGYTGMLEEPRMPGARPGM